jgi:hypothetical protein
LYPGGRTPAAKVGLSACLGDAADRSLCVTRHGSATDLLPVLDEAVRVCEAGGVAIRK